MPSTKKMEGKVAIVTGGASGIGEVTARIFAENGCRVALLDVDGLRLTKVVDDIRAIQKECYGVYGDVTEEKTVIEFFRGVVQKWGKLDVLVGIAGRDFLTPLVSEATLRSGTKPSRSI